MSTPPPAQLKDKALWHDTSFVNNEWLPKTKTFDVGDPGSGKVLGKVADHGADETKRAIDAAHAAYLKWSRCTGKERGAALARLAALMRESADDLATIITMENGKNKAESAGEVVMSLGQLDWMSAEAERGYGDVIPSALPNVRNIVIKQAIGVAGIITPWNFPLSMGVRKVAAALAAGATIVAKAPRETPYSSLAFAELCVRAGLPAGCFNVVTTSSSSSVGSELCANPLVRKISFTGSTNIGRLLAKQSASTLKKCSFELGGNAPFIIFEDADLDAAVESAAATKFRCSGQVCIATNRVLVHSKIYDEFAKRLAARVGRYKVGYGLDADVTHGPLINAAAVKKVQEHIDDALAQGGSLIAGGTAMEGNYFTPTIIGDGSLKMAAASDETFGPLAILYRFETDEEAIALANDTDYGLAAYFWTERLDRAWRVAEALNSGMVGINGASVSQACAPFGGINQSGYGREGSKYGMEEYQEVKLIAMSV